jgi:plastocyanin
MTRTRKRYCLVAAASLAGLALFVGGIALAATTTVTLGAAGPQPATVTVQWGDTVAFHNGGERALGITIPRVALASPIIGPGTSWSRVFDGRTGNYLFRQTEGRGFLGTVIVELKGSVTMKATPPTVVYGGRVTLSGQALAGHAVKLEQVIAADAGQWDEVVSVTAGADGKWSTSLAPKLGARFRATAAAGQLRSPAVSVRVQPAVTLLRPARLKKGAVATIRGRVLPAGSASVADLERYDTVRRRWVREDRRTVTRAGTVAFRWKAVKGRSRLRVQLQRYGMKPGYDPVASKPTTVTAS